MACFFKFLTKARRKQTIFSLLLCCLSFSPLTFPPLCRAEVTEKETGQNFDLPAQKRLDDSSFKRALSFTSDQVKEYGAKSLEKWNLIFDLIKSLDPSFAGDHDSHWISEQIYMAEGFYKADQKMTLLEDELKALKKEMLNENGTIKTDNLAPPQQKLERILKDVQASSIDALLRLDKLISDSKIRWFAAASDRIKQRKILGKSVTRSDKLMATQPQDPLLDLSATP